MPSGAMQDNISHPFASLLIAASVGASIGALFSMREVVIRRFPEAEQRRAWRIALGLQCAVVAIAIWCDYRQSWSYPHIFEIAAGFLIGDLICRVIDLARAVARRQ